VNGTACAAPLLPSTCHRRCRLYTCGKPAEGAAACLGAGACSSFLRFQTTKWRIHSAAFSPFALGDFMRRAGRRACDEAARFGVNACTAMRSLRLYRRQNRRWMGTSVGEQAGFFYFPSVAALIAAHTGQARTLFSLWAGPPLYYALPLRLGVRLSLFLRPWRGRRRRAAKSVWHGRRGSMAAT